MNKVVICLISAILSVDCVSQNELRPINEVPSDIDSVKVVIPIYSQRIAFRLPTTWKAASHDQNANVFLIEFTPNNENINSWSNLVSVQGFRNLAERGNSEQFLDSLASRFEAVCGENVVYEKIDALLIDGYKSTTAILGCSDLPSDQPTDIGRGQSEIGYYFSIEGEKDIYLIHKSIRGSAFEVEEPPFNKDNISSFIQEFMPIELCKNTGGLGVCNK